MAVGLTLERCVFLLRPSFYLKQVSKGSWVNDLNTFVLCRTLSRNDKCLLKLQGLSMLTLENFNEIPKQVAIISRRNFIVFCAKYYYTFVYLTRQTLQNNFYKGTQVGIPRNSNNTNVNSQSTQDSSEQVVNAIWLLFRCDRDFVGMFICM